MFIHIPITSPDQIREMYRPTFINGCNASSKFTAGNNLVVSYHYPSLKIIENVGYFESIPSAQLHSHTTGVWKPKGSPSHIKNK